MPPSRKTRGGSDESRARQVGKPVIGKQVKALTFDGYFSKQFGMRRWTQIRAACLAPDRHFKVALWNRYSRDRIENHTSGPRGLVPVPGATSLQLLQLPALPSVAEVATKPAEDACDTALDTAPVVAAVAPSAATADDMGDDDNTGGIPVPTRDEQRILNYYIFDAASAFVVQALGVEPHHKVLDLCAAPGGKSVAISQLLSTPHGGELTCNEAQTDRRQRLERTIRDYVPINTAKVSVVQRDGKTYHAPNVFDRVLVDAPCSAERHLLIQQNAALLRWSAEYTARFAGTQIAMVLRGLECLKVGGVLVYSTCSLSTMENDDVVEGALQRTRCGIEVVPTKLPVGEATAHGWIVLPDVCNGAGPMYCATFRKTAQLRAQSESDDSGDSDDSDEA